MSDRNIENAIEWLTGQDRITVSLTQKRFINRVMELSKDPENGVEIVAINKDGSVCAHLPLKSLHLTIFKGNPSNLRAKSDLPEEDEDNEED